jgi:hypothetical protein
MRRALFFREVPLTLVHKVIVDDPVTDVTTFGQSGKKLRPAALPYSVLSTAHHRHLTLLAVTVRVDYRYDCRCLLRVGHDGHEGA